jgi:hypothetical protein
MGYELIETVTLDAGAAQSILFQNIPQDGLDLVVVCSFRGTGSAVTLCNVVFNGDNTNANYAGVAAIGNNGSANPDTNYPRPMFYIPDTRHLNFSFGTATVYISSYALTNAQKPVLTNGTVDNNSSNDYQTIHGSTWKNNSAITSILLPSSRNNLAQWSTASLYKITSS